LTLWFFEVFHILICYFNIICQKKKEASATFLCKIPFAANILSISPHFYILKVNAFFLFRQILSETYKTLVLFAIYRFRVFIPKIVDKVNNSVYKSIFPTFSLQKLWISFCGLPPGFFCFLPKFGFLCSSSKKHFLP